jgi:hypothetical protein
MKWLECWGSWRVRDGEAGRMEAGVPRDLRSPGASTRKIILGQGSPWYSCRAAGGLTSLRCLGLHPPRRGDCVLTTFRFPTPNFTIRLLLQPPPPVNPPVPVS